MSRLISRGIIQAKNNPLDARVRLVNLAEIRALYQESSNRMGDTDEET
jgi:hypothetical protein